MNNEIVQSIPIAQITPDPNQPRRTFDAESLTRLAETIRVNGIELPLRVVRRAERRYEIISGERRWRAAKIARLDTLPCLVEEPAKERSPSRLRLRRLLENTAREDLLPLDLADAVEAVMAESGMTAAEVARQIGLSEGYVSKLRRLRAELPPDTKERLAKGEVTVGECYQIVQTNTERAGHAPKAEQNRTARLAQKIRRAQRVGVRRKITLPVDTGVSLSIVARDLTLQRMAAWFGSLADRVKAALERGLTLDAFTASIRSAKHDAKGAV